MNYELSIRLSALNKGGITAAGTVEESHLVPF